MTFLIISFYALLFGGSAIIFFLNKKIYQITHEWSVALASFILYYWGIAGAWILIPDQLSGEKGKSIGLHYYYIFEKLFKVEIDWIYFESILSYTIFIVIFLTALLFSIRKSSFSKAFLSPDQLPQVNSIFILTTTVFLVVVSGYVMRKELFYAVSFSKSIYLITRNSNNGLKSIHQLANNYIVFVPLYGILILQNAPKKLYDKILIYLSIFIGISYLTALGNRHELVFSGLFILFFLLKWFLEKIISLKKIILVSSIIAIPIILSDPARAIFPIVISQLYHPNLSKEELSELNKINVYASDDVVTATSHALANVAFSNELFFANFSMYGILKKNVAVTNGTSIEILKNSLLPKFIFHQKNTQEDIYSYYARSVNAKPGQGYSIYNSTAWYLNFGWIGILLGAIVLMLFFYIGFWLRLKSANTTNFFLKFTYFSFLFLLAAQFPSIVRSGPENIKSILFEALLIPMSIIFCMYYATKLLNKLK